MNKDLSFTIFVGFNPVCKLYYTTSQVCNKQIKMSFHYINIYKNHRLYQNFMIYIKLTPGKCVLQKSDNSQQSFRSWAIHIDENLLYFNHLLFHCSTTHRNIVHLSTAKAFQALNFWIIMLWTMHSYLFQNMNPSQACCLYWLHFFLAGLLFSVLNWNFCSNGI